MALKIKNTANYRAQNINICVIGPAGVGKTTLAATLPKPIVLSMEAGLLSLRGLDVDYIEIGSIEDLMEAIAALKGPSGDPYESVILDSISEFSFSVKKQVEAAQPSAKDKDKNTWKIYGDIADQTVDLLKMLRDLPKHVVLIAQERMKGGNGDPIKYIPRLEGTQAGERLPYLFDEVFYMRFVDEVTKSGERYLQTVGDNLRDAKDRSGRLAPKEPPHLGNVIRKINGEQTAAAVGEA